MTVSLRDLAILVCAAVCAGIAGWVARGAQGSPAVRAPVASVRQAPTAEGVLYRDQAVALLYLCHGEDRYLVLDVGAQFWSAFQRNGCSKDVW